MTRGTIITEALTQIGRQDLTSNARLWLNLFLQKIYMTQDWNWLLKTSEGLSITQGGVVPTDYRALKTMTVIIPNSSSRAPILTITPAQWAQYRLTRPTGVPRRCFIDENLIPKTFQFWPAPDKNYTFDLQYYRLPALPDPSDATTDLLTPVWGAHDDFLIRAVQLKGMYFNEDSRYQQEEKDLMEELIQSKMNIYDDRAGKNSMAMGKSYRRRWGPTNAN